MAAVACSSTSGTPDNGPRQTSNSSGDSAGGSTGSAGSTAGEGAGGGQPDGYPPGPYGDGSPPVGAVLENLSFRGYVNPSGEGVATQNPLQDYSFADFRLSGPRYALIHIGSVW